MSQTVNSQTAPLQILLDSRKALSLSDDGSTALFDLVGGVKSNVESTTAIITIREFTAGNAIYNITNQNNQLEFGIQTISEFQANTIDGISVPPGYVETSHIDQTDLATPRKFYYNPIRKYLITIPPGNYDTEDLCKSMSYHM